MLLPILSICLATAFGQLDVPKEACPTPCGPGQCNHKDGNCVKQANLHEACDATRLCEPAYSSCVGGKCQCLPGFEEVSFHCYPATYTCPGTAPIPRAKAKQCIVDANECDGPIQGAGISTGFDGPNFGQRCLRPLKVVEVTGMETQKMNKTDIPLGRMKRHVVPKVGYQYNGGCAEDEVCTITSGFQISKCHAYGIGHCCKQSCPFGSPHPLASCQKGAYGECSRIPGYACHRGYLTPGAIAAFGEMIDEFFPAACCPVHCEAGRTTADVGHCYPETKGLDAACWRDEQCFDRKCIRGMCVCEPGLRRVVFPGGLGEACVNATSAAQLGESCSQAAGDVCGVDNSKCWEGRCVCGCGYTAVGNSRCDRAAVGCPSSDAMYSCGLWANQGECKRNPNWMIANCPFACGVCGSQYNGRK